METETPLLTQPFAHMQALDELGEVLHVNVPETERLFSLASGVAALAIGLSHRSLSGSLLALTGGALLMRGATGHCMLYKALGVQPVRNSKQ